MPETFTDDALFQKTGFRRFETTDDLDRRITFYLSGTEHDGALPLILWVQGSGYHPAFWADEDGIKGQQQMLLRHTLKREARILSVEKPGIFPSNDGATAAPHPRHGTASGAPGRFLQEHTLERWTTALSAAMRHTRGHFPCGARTLAAGHSEGAAACARLARLDGSISHVAMLGGSGPSQLFDFLYQAKDADARAEILSHFQSLEQNDDAAAEETLLWGHPRARWRSFLASSAAEDLAHTHARVFLAHGTGDDKVPFASALALLSELLRLGRKVTFHPVEGGDHGFRTEGDEAHEGFINVFNALLDWFDHQNAKEASSP